MTKREQKDSKMTRVAAGASSKAALCMLTFMCAICAMGSACKDHFSEVFSLFPEGVQLPNPGCQAYVACTASTFTQGACTQAHTRSQFLKNHIHIMYTYNCVCMYV